MEDFNSKYSGKQVEDLLDQIASGNAGGGGGIAVETDPIFSASPAAEITEDDISGWRNLGNDFSLLDKDVADLTYKVEDKQDAISDLETIRDGAAKGATAVQAEDVLGIVSEEGFVTAEDLAKVATSGSYNDLVDKPTFKTINNESIEGSGNITISGGSGQQGPQGDKGDKGDTGVGVQSVTQTTTSNADGGSNVVTVTLTDGTKSTFTVKNGSKGSQGDKGEQGPKGDTGANGTNGKDGTDGATFTPSVDSAGNLSWTNNKGLTNPPTVNIKGPKGDAGEGGGDSSGGGKEIVLNSNTYFDDVSPVQPNKIYIYSTSFFSLNIGAFQEVSDYDEYCIIFKYPEYFALPDSVKFANGQIPTIEYDTECELSVVGIGSGANRTYHAVLTPFKAL